jgi:hypothetical protein
MDTVLGAKKSIQQYLADAVIAFDNDIETQRDGHPNPSRLGVTTGIDKQGLFNGVFTTADLHAMFQILKGNRSYSPDKFVLGLPSVSATDTWRLERNFLWLRICQLRTLRVREDYGHVLLFSTEDDRSVVARNVSFKCAA